MSKEWNSCFVCFWSNVSYSSHLTFALGILFVLLLDIKNILFMFHLCFGVSICMLVLLFLNWIFIFDLCSWVSICLHVLPTWPLIDGTLYLYSPRHLTRWNYRYKISTIENVGLRNNKAISQKLKLSLPWGSKCWQSQKEAQTHAKLSCPFCPVTWFFD